MSNAELMEDIWRLITLADYNTRVVLLGSAILGLCAGVMGSFMMLRRRAMISDVVSHAALPGIAAAFMISAGWPSGGKYLPFLLLGALISGLLGMGCVHVIKRYSHIKEDAALGIVLSVFFGLGVALLGIIQQMNVGSAAGLETFIYGKTASMLAADAWLMAVSAMVVIVLTLILFKEFRLICFDQEFAQAQGWPAHGLDLLLTGLVVLVTVIGLQAVGLILMIALLIIPPAAARFWTDRLGVMIVLSALIGAMSAVMGAGLSALYPRLPAGAMIVMVCSTLFTFGFFFGTRRGIVIRMLQHARLSARIARHHLLRALYECVEAGQPQKLVDVRGGILVNVHQVAATRGWSQPKLGDLIRQAEREGDVAVDAWPMIRVTSDGWRDACAVVRNHRLWEWYLISHADVDASHVDRDADEIEHVLGTTLVSELEATLAIHDSKSFVPHSPHRIVVPVHDPAENAP